MNNPIKSQIWEPIGPIGGDMFTCLHLDTANQILYVGTEEGFWYNDLNVDEWTSRVEVGWIGRSVKSINSYSAFPGRIITGRVNAWFKGYVEVSYDWGVTNEIPFFSDGGFISDIKYSSSNTDVFYACGRSDITPGDILKSSDGGQNWLQLSNYIQTHMTSMAISPSSSDILYVSGDARVTKTDDGGLSWSLASNGLPSNLGVYSVAMNRSDEHSLICSNDNGLYRTTDAGENWELIYAESCKKIVYNPIYPNTVTALTFNTSQILLSTNNGNDWINITGNFPFGSNKRDIEFSEDGTVLYTISDNNVYTSEIVISGVESVEKEWISTSSPNPFNEQTSIYFYLDRKQAVKVVVYDISGKEIQVLIAETLLAGEHRIIWDGKTKAGSKVDNGVYFYSITSASGDRIINKMLKF